MQEINGHFTEPCSKCGKVWFKTQVYCNPIHTYRYGRCERYVREIKECSDALRFGIDYVFISNSLGTQTNIGTALDEIALPLLASEDEECLQKMYKVICHYYLPPCGNITHHPFLPSSLCQEECSYVQSTCPTLWQAATVALSDFSSFINCSSTSQLLFPLPNCCTSAGVKLNRGLLAAQCQVFTY